MDASDGYSDFQVQALAYIRKRSRKVPVIGGNLITAEGFRFLAEAGFDGIKVGMGIGSGCTTQEQKGVGRGQATALLEIVHARNEFSRPPGSYLPVISDGGISNPGQMVVALAMGADAIMMGRFFAQFTESAGGIRMHPQHGPLKEYWMEASARARSYGTVRDDLGPLLRGGHRGICAPHRFALREPPSHTPEDPVGALECWLQGYRGARTARPCSSGSPSPRCRMLLCTTSSRSRPNLFKSGFSLPSHVSQRHWQDREREILREQLDQGRNRARTEAQNQRWRQAQGGQTL